MLFVVKFFIIFRYLGCIKFDFLSGDDGFWGNCCFFVVEVLVFSFLSSF